MDWITRYEHGEFFSKDSIKLDENLRYSTGLGRPVYGGGGIMPDVFVPQDTTGVSSYLIEVSNKGLILQFSFQYTDRNRAKLSEYDNEEDLLKYLRHQSIVEQFVRFADSKGVKRRNLLIHKSYKLLERSLYGTLSITYWEGSNTSATSTRAMLPSRKHWIFWNVARHSPKLRKQHQS